ncbi:MAG: phenylalanine 4-monooxygenase [Salinivirgaceae bacterium]|nr:MAG: phenylalanine 4-monooxygenase [Salinivirgaceae bacterium]
MESNEILDKLPDHLRELIIDQPYNAYTPQDHAIWRYVMRQNVRYLPKVAHHSYMEGLNKTGISINEIPHMYGMNRILKEIGWAAASVDGFIPPAAFMEFQAYNVLVIAADIRPIDQVGYTPAPDIIHEAAGHAPIIADEEYANYLRRFGEIGAKAFATKADHDMYEAIRLLSILKADPYSSKEDIEQAEKEIEKLEYAATKESELTQIRNLHWWTVEYGLIGDLENPKIYGAGLLSSIGESYSCLQDHVKKIPYTLEAAKTGFDITKQQPQLFVTPDFKHLTTILEKFSENMAFNAGSLCAVRKAIESGITATIELNTGIQVSGTFTEVIELNGTVIYVRTKGETALAYQNKEIEDQGRTHHKDGFGFPVGKVYEFDRSLHYLDQQTIEDSLDDENYLTLHYKSGIELKGKPYKYTTREGKLVIITFKDCTVKIRDKVLFAPEWGIYDLAVGQNVASGYPGPADKVAFGYKFPKPKSQTHKIKHSDTAKGNHARYAKIKQIRNGEKVKESTEELWQQTLQYTPEEWLLMLELLEQAQKENKDELANEIKTQLEKLAQDDRYKKLIEDGLMLIKKEQSVEQMKNK